MMIDRWHGITRWMAPAAVILGAILHCGCGDGGAAAGETQFLARRVEVLEEKVRELEARTSRAPLGETVTAAAPAAAAPGAGAGPGQIPPKAAAPPFPAGNSLASQLGSEEDRANIFLLKVKQLQVAPRSGLPQLIVDLGISAPELGDDQNRIAGLQAEKTRLLADPAANSARLAALEEELDKLKYRLEIAAEGVRSRLIEEGKELSARVEQMRNEAKRADEGAPAAGSETP